MIACHDPGSFKNPDQFLPERWLNDGEKSSCRGSDAGVNIVVPFGIGKRQCPGRRFVEMELILILAKVKQKFRFAMHFYSSFDLLLFSAGQSI